MDRMERTGRRRGADLWAQLLVACTDGVTEGLRTQIPGAVGIVLKTVALCVSLKLAHLLLGVPVPAGGVGAGAATVIYALKRALRSLGDRL
jgi:hypothetical protein